MGWVGEGSCVEVVLEFGFGGEVTIDVEFSRSIWLLTELCGHVGEVWIGIWVVGVGFNRGRGMFFLGLTKL